MRITVRTPEAAAVVYDVENLVSSWIRENFVGLDEFKIYSHTKRPGIFVYLEWGTLWGTLRPEDEFVTSTKVKLLCILFYEHERSSFDVCVMDNVGTQEVLHLADPNFFEHLSLYVIECINIILGLSNAGFSVASSLPLRIV